jgi:hypothetical protein
VAFARVPTSFVQIVPALGLAAAAGPAKPKPTARAVTAIARLIVVKARAFAMRSIGFSPVRYM